jgi:urocanate hydratase
MAAQPLAARDGRRPPHRDRGAGQQIEKRLETRYVDHRATSIDQAVGYHRQGD